MTFQKNVCYSRCLLSYFLAVGLSFSLVIICYTVGKCILDNFNLFVQKKQFTKKHKISYPFFLMQQRAFEERRTLKKKTASNWTQQFTYFFLAIDNSLLFKLNNSITIMVVAFSELHILVHRYPSLSPRKQTYRLNCYTKLAIFIPFTSYMYYYLYKKILVRQLCFIKILKLNFCLKISFEYISLLYWNPITYI